MQFLLERKTSVCLWSVFLAKLKLICGLCCRRSHLRMTWPSKADKEGKHVLKIFFLHSNLLRTQTLKCRLPFSSRVALWTLYPNSRSWVLGQFALGSIPCASSGPVAGRESWPWGFLSLSTCSWLLPVGAWRRGNGRRLEVGEQRGAGALLLTFSLPPAASQAAALSLPCSTSHHRSRPQLQFSPKNPRLLC